MPAANPVIVVPVPDPLPPPALVQLQMKGAGAPVILIAMLPFEPALQALANVVINCRSHVTTEVFEVLNTLSQASVILTVIGHEVVDGSAGGVNIAFVLSLG